MTPEGFSYGLAHARQRYGVTEAQLKAAND